MSVMSVLWLLWWILALGRAVKSLFSFRDATFTFALLTHTYTHTLHPSPSPSLDITEWVLPWKKRKLFPFYPQFSLFTRFHQYTCCALAINRWAKSAIELKWTKYTHNWLHPIEWSEFDFTFFSFSFSFANLHDFASSSSRLSKSYVLIFLTLSTFNKRSALWR